MKIGIIGCGWTGLPLAKKLIQEGHQVVATFRNESKLNNALGLGIDGYLIDSAHFIDSAQLFFKQNFELLIISVPPGIRSGKGEAYIKMLHDIIALSEKTNSVRKIIFFSTTGIYPDIDSIMDESYTFSTKEEEENLFYVAEQVIWKSKIDSLILRVGGLCGYDRNLVKYFSGKDQLPSKNHPVNLIHRDDVIEFILFLLRKGFKKDILNLCAPKHPTKEVFYTYTAEQTAFIKPNYNKEDLSGNKTVSTKKIEEQYGYSFVYPDPLLFDYQV